MKGSVELAIEYLDEQVRIAIINQIELELLRELLIDILKYKGNEK